jgi:lipopolysaccharide export system permease protein
VIVFRYIFKETLKTQLSILLILLLIFTSQQFIRILARAADGSVPTSLIGQMMLLNIPYMGLLLLPVSLFIAILFAHGRLYAESEMTVLRAVGAGPSYVMKVSIALALLTTVVATVNTMWLAPASREQQSQLLDEAKADPLSIPLDSGRFVSLDGGRIVTYVDNVQGNGKDFHHIFLLQESVKPEASAVVVAKQGHIQYEKDGSAWAIFKDGRRYAGTPPETAFTIANFAEYRAQIQRKDIEPSNRKTSALSSAEVFHSTNKKEIAEWQWRVVLSLSIPVLTLIAVPLAAVNPRQGRYAKIFPAILLYLSYFLLLSAGQSAIERGQISPTPGLYVLPVIYIILFALPMNLQGSRVWHWLRFHWHKDKA